MFKLYLWYVIIDLCNDVPTVCCEAITWNSADSVQMLRNKTKIYISRKKVHSSEIDQHNVCLLREASMC